MRKLLFCLSLTGAIATSSNAAVFTFETNLSGLLESPPNPSAGTGHAVVTFDDVLHLLTVQVDFSGLTGTTTMSHIHCCTAIPHTGNVGVATETPTFSLFPLGVTSGTFYEEYDTWAAATYNPPFLNSAANMGDPKKAADTLLKGLQTGTAYLNIHTTFRTGGEIRGFLAPEPSTYALVGLALAGAAALRKRIKI